MKPKNFPKKTYVQTHETRNALRSSTTSRAHLQHIVFSLQYKGFSTKGERQVREVGNSLTVNDVLPGPILFSAKSLIDGLCFSSRESEKRGTYFLSITINSES